MKTVTLKLFLISLFSTSIFISCSKGDKTIDRNTALLTQKSWKFEIYGLDENNNGTIEESENGMSACEADDVYTFNSNGSGVFAGGVAQCTPGEALTINFNWTFFNHGTELAIFAAPEKINRLDENTLEVYYMDQNLQGEAVKYIRRFRH